MHTKKLLIALLITIAMFCGIFFFSDMGATLSTGQIVTMCLGALAWLGLLIFPNFLHQSGQNQLTEAPKAEASNLSGSFVELLNTIQAELSNQIVATEAELNQVKTLMDGAIDDLVDSFISLEATTRMEQNLVKLLASDQEIDDTDELNPFRDAQIKSKQFLLETLEKLNNLIEDATQSEAVSTSGAANKKNPKLQSGGKLLSQRLKEVALKVISIIEENNANTSMVAGEIVMIAAQIERDVQTAVQSLQFQDMTTQLIVQSGERLKIMQEILNSINSINNKNTAAEDSIHEWQTRLVAAHDEIKQASKVRMKRFNVDAGSVELFD